MRKKYFHDNDKMTIWKLVGKLYDEVPSEIIERCSEENPWDIYEGFSVVILGGMLQTIHGGPFWMQLRAILRKPQPKTTTLGKWTLTSIPLTLFFQRLYSQANVAVP